MLRADPHGQGWGCPTWREVCFRRGLVLVARSCSHHRNRGYSAKSRTRGHSAMCLLLTDPASLTLAQGARCSASNQGCSLGFSLGMQGCVIPGRSLDLSGLQFTCKIGRITFSLLALPTPIPTPLASWGLKGEAGRGERSIKISLLGLERRQCGRAGRSRGLASVEE